MNAATSIESGIRERRETVVREHVEAERRKDIDATIATFEHPRYEIVPTGDVHDGADAVRAMHEYLAAAFPDMQLEEGELRHCDDAVVAEGWITATHGGSFLGLPPTGRALRYRVLALFLFDEDRLVGERVYFDRLEILRGLGFASDPGTLRAGLELLVTHPLRLIRATARGLGRRIGRR